MGNLVPLEAAGKPAETRHRAASKKQLAEMDKLLAGIAEGGTKAFAEAVAKRSWLKRGIQAMVDAGDMIDHCPSSERPFFQFAHTLHETALERMFALGERKMHGDFRVYQQFLERLWRDEYGKYEGAGAGGVTVVIVERPPRG